jgi:hypothetical protein
MKLNLHVHRLQCILKIIFKRSLVDTCMQGETHVFTIGNAIGHVERMDCGQRAHASGQFQWTRRVDYNDNDA